MLRRSSLFIYLILAVSWSTCAQFRVEGTIEGTMNKNLILLQYFGDSHSFIDSARTDGNGWFSFEMPEKSPPGLYSIAIGKQPLFNFIFSGEDIVLKFDPTRNGLPQVIHSLENMVYYDYLVRKDIYSQKSLMLQDILQYYPGRDSFCLYAERHFQNLQAEYRDYTNWIIDEYPASVVSHMVRSDRPVMIPESVDWGSIHAFNQSHYLDGVDFSDTLLVNTNILTAKAIDYLGFYTINSQNKELQEQFFIQAVDTILNKAMADGKVYNFMLQYLIEGFEMYGFDRVISHIADHYEPANTCVNEERKSELEKRMESLRKLTTGNTAPDIIMEGINNKKTTLRDIDSDLTVVLFWASWCPHCNDMIPELIKLYHDPMMPAFEILAVSIDTSAEDYNEYLAQHPTPWINFSEFKGWDSRAAIDYSVYATPTMFLLDRNRKIIGRPVTASDLRDELQKLK